jgi:hypothetical protein
MIFSKPPRGVLSPRFLRLDENICRLYNFSKLAQKGGKWPLLRKKEIASCECAFVRFINTRRKEPQTEGKFNEE